MINGEPINDLPINAYYYAPVPVSDGTLNFTAQILFTGIFTSAFPNDQLLIEFNDGQ